jgi:hypothetical protein
VTICYYFLKSSGSDTLVQLRQVAVKKSIPFCILESRKLRKFSRYLSGAATTPTTGEKCPSPHVRVSNPYLVRMKRGRAVWKITITALENIKKLYNQGIIKQLKW